MSSFHLRLKSGKKGTAVEHATYITRQGCYSKREDLIAAGHGNMPHWATTPHDFWRAGDKYERKNGAVYREHEIALPEELTQAQQLHLVSDLITVLVGEKPYQYAVHANESSLEGVRNTHLHLMFSDRMPDEFGRTPEQTFRRYNAQSPEKGGCRKDSGGKDPLALRDKMIGTRRACAVLQNEALARHGHSARVDHRTLRQQGILRTPEQHLGQAQIKHMGQEEKMEFVAARRIQNT